MITLEEPHMGLNDVTGPYKVHMWKTSPVYPTTTLQHILEEVAEAARRAPGGKLRNLVFCCHGMPAYLFCGQGIGRADTARFTVWRDLVEKIWFSACNLAYSTPASGRGCAPGPAHGDGHMFCSEIAQAAQCYVVASTELQAYTAGRTLPYGKLDSFEGLVLSYNPAGEVSWSHRYPSTYQTWFSGWYRNPN